MRLFGVLGALVLIVDLPLTATVEAQAVSGTIDKSAPATAAQARSPLLANCVESDVTASPLPPRPSLRRATYSAKPHRHHARPKHKAKVVHKAKPIRHVQHKRKIHARRPIAHHHAPTHHPILRRVTYASPLCAARSTELNHMLGLPGLDDDQASLAGTDSLPGDDNLPAFIDVPPLFGGGVGPITGGGPGGPGTIVFPTGPGPLYPVGPGPIILAPPGPPVGPPVTPPVTPPVVSNAPEPASWAMMLGGFGAIGLSLRRRRIRMAA